jgi:hypothetical protein
VRPPQRLLGKEATRFLIAKSFKKLISSSHTHALYSLDSAPDECTFVQHATIFGSVKSIAFLGGTSRILLLPQVLWECHMVEL